MTVSLPCPAVLNAHPEALSAIREADCHLAVWQRTAIPELAALLNDPLQDIRFSETLDNLATRLDAELELAGYRTGAPRAALLADILDLAQRYSAIMELDALSVRLAIIRTDSCRKFHEDYVKARLITTYVGMGTQWLDTHDAQRFARNQEPLQICTLKTGDVGIFKGKLWSQNPAIHRSPPIGGTGAVRLMLVLDPPTNR